MYGIILRTQPVPLLGFELNHNNRVCWLFMILFHQLQGGIKQVQDSTKGLKIQSNLLYPCNTKNIDRLDFMIELVFLGAMDRRGSQ